MAKHKVFSILDTKANAFMPPFTTHTNGLAVRMFKTTVNDSDNIVHKYPADFRLACIGTFDDNTGLLAPAEPEWLGFGTDFIDTDKQQPMPLLRSTT